MPLPTAASPASGCPAEPGALLVGLAVALLLASACSRAPGRATVAPREDEEGATPSRPLTAAETHLAQGEAALKRRETDRAREEAEKARVLFEQDGSREGFVRAKNLLGAAASREGNYEAALEHLNAALAAAQQSLAPGHGEIARSYYEIGLAHVETGRPRQGLELLAKALALRRSAGGPQTREATRILIRMGVAHADLGEDDEALALFADAEATERATPGTPLLAEALTGKGVALWGQARYEQAVEALEQAIRLLEAAGSPRQTSLASAYTQLGTIYGSKGDYDEALAYTEKALRLQVAILGEMHPEVGIDHFNLADFHLSKRDYGACVASAERALKIFLHTLGERHDLVVQTYNILGSALTGQGEPDRALVFLEKALSVQLSLAEKGNRDSARIYTSLADAHRAKRDFPQAARRYRQALAIDASIHGERHPDLAEDYVNLGNLCLEQHEDAEALRFFGKAIAANAPHPVKSDPGLDPPIDSVYSDEFLLKALQGAARARARRAAKLQDRQQQELAALVYEHASRLIDRMRAGYRAEGSKLSISASATEVYDEAIHLELDLFRVTGEERHREAAFRYAEKSKAGILRDALNEAEARAYARIPEPILEKERQLRIDLAAVDHRLNEAQLEAVTDEVRLQALREKQFDLKREYDALQARLEKEHPDYYDLKYRFDTAGPTDVRQRALDAGTVLVEYFLGREQVYIFSLTGRDLEVTSVAREASLEAEAGELRRAILERDFASYARSAHRLYRVLLAPIEDRLEGQDFVVVPDGPLSVVPFEALLTREASPGTDSRELPYVLRDHAVSYAYSATVLLQGLRRRGEGPPDAFVGFAPAFGDRAGSADSPSLLPAARQEVADVRRLFARQQGLFGGWLSGRSRVYLDRAATERRFKSAGLERYRYVHLATHGIVDEAHPGLSRLLLGPERGSGEDGVLHLGEVYNLRLNADLVVLSACDTGRGRIARGEGLIGFTRGFLYAGARNLLVSLWPVSDAAASGLLVDFYAELLAGRPKARALRAAKLRAMGRHAEYAKPFYWSPLVLVGQ